MHAGASADSELRYGESMPMPLRQTERGAGQDTENQPADVGDRGREWTFELSEQGRQDDDGQDLGRQARRQPSCRRQGAAEHESGKAIDAPRNAAGIVIGISSEQHLSRERD